MNSKIFANYPIINGYKIQNRLVDAMDLTVRTAYIKEFKENPQYYIEYGIQEGETAEMIANRVYGDINLFWVILMINEIHDVDNEWPLDRESLARFIADTYSDPHDTKLYVSATSGAIVDPQFEPEWNVIKVSNTQYEEVVNELKRNIIIPHPNYIDLIVRRHNAVLRG